jgi:hypothetical protein
MTNESYFAVMCAAIFAQLFGALLAFAGYRFFIFLLPVWGFLFGFGVGAQIIQGLFGMGFLSDITSWIVGFIVGLLFAVLSYLFYFVAVAILGFSLGYAIGIGLMGLIGFEFGFLTVTVGIVIGLIVGWLTIALNVQKWVIIIATAFAGSAIIVGTYLFLFGGLPSSRIVEDPVRVALQNSPFWLITFLILTFLAVVVQFQANQNFEVESYNRLNETMSMPQTDIGPALPVAAGGTIPVVSGTSAAGADMGAATPAAPTPAADTTSGDQPEPGTSTSTS